MLAIKINYYNRTTHLSITTWCYIDEKVHFVGCSRSFVRLLQWESGTYFPASGYGSDNLRGPISVYGERGRTSAIAISRLPVLDAGTISLLIGVFVWLSQWTHSRHSLKLTCLLRLTLSVTPCWFGVRIDPLYPPACRKRRLKGGVRSNLVVTLAAARFQGPRFYPGQGINLDRDFCSMHTPVPPLGPQHRVPEPVPSLETHLKSE